ncbi:MAG TPA: molybdopterin-dependent oxidoreductase [Candidatus Manganitrophaceae bacterium]|nr:molybdopterin-dependent oxidoreductase [Candidatus Manganitrophaceae bacterium]
MEIDRREFLKILGAGGATAALVGCSAEPPEKLIPYLIPPEDVVPGVAVWYATVCGECPSGCGMIVRTREGRAVKVEGNPSHPINQGRLCARGQATLQGLYNPDRIRQPLLRDRSGRLQPISWEEAESLMAARLADLRRRGEGDRVVFVAPLLTGSLGRLIDEWLEALGSKRRLVYEPFAYEPLRAANRIAFRQEAIPTYDIESAKVLVSFGADFLETWISPVSYSREFASFRAYREGRIGTFFYVGPRLSMTAANADRWIPIKPGTDHLLALGMTHLILAEGLASPLPPGERERIRTAVQSYTPERVAQRTEVPEGTVFRLARAFARGRPALALGGGLGNSTADAAAVNLLNYVVGAVGKTVRFGPNAGAGRAGAYRDLLGSVDAMMEGEVQALLLYNVNPLFTLPQAVRFREALRRVPFVVSFSSFMDETTAEAGLVLPDHTSLESWGDDAPRVGVHGLAQPAARPIFQTKQIGDTLLSLARRLGDPMARRFPSPDFHEYLREGWKRLHRRLAPDAPFETFWEKALRQGGVWEEIKTEEVGLSEAFFKFSFEEMTNEPAGPERFYLHLYPSLSHFDGRGANRPWLQELPDPMAQIVWDNWLEIHPATAQRLGIAEGDLVKVASPDGEVEAPAHLFEGVRPDVAAIPLGQGHTAFGRYAEGRGENPMRLLPSPPEPLSGGPAFHATRVTLTPTGKRHLLASPVGSDRQGERNIVQAVPLSGLGKEEIEKGEDGAPHALEMYPPHPHPEHRWGMVIDLNVCTGCSACVVACYAENNLPVVGKEQFAKGREMAWIRIERYFEGEPNRPESRFLPMLCQHCDHAPCEPVCPVYATYHTPEGLNAQVYNRCIGVRYCSNNCPYKVRRFNWFDSPWTEPLHLQLNPDVTVRSKGVMEKCTFCVQRIKEAEDRAKDEGRPVRDGEITPACAQTCPTRAIVFGDLKDPGSEVSKRARTPRRYRVLEHLNTKPAITYLKKILQDTEQV